MTNETPLQDENVDASSMIPAWLDGVLQPVDKLEVHLKGLRHKAVSVFVFQGSQVLIQKRADGKYHTPGLWANTCCTHPLWDETPADCAVRRLNQELGISGLFPAYRSTVEYKADVGNGMIEHEVVDIFVAHVVQPVVLDPDPEEVSDTRWVNYYDLCAEIDRRPERFTPWLRIYVQEHGDTIAPR